MNIEIIKYGMKLNFIEINLIKIKISKDKNSLILLLNTFQIFTIDFLNHLSAVFDYQFIHLIVEFLNTEFFNFTNKYSINSNSNIQVDI